MAAHNLTYVDESTDTKTLVPEDAIREAGWMRESEEEPCHLDHCEDDSCDCPSPRPVLDVLERWHNENHPGVIRFCDERPCSDLRTVD